MPKSKSGIIESPAGYNGKAPASVTAPVKSYPMTDSKVPKSPGKVIEGPADNACYNAKK